MTNGTTGVHLFVSATVRSSRVRNVHCESWFSCVPHNHRWIKFLV